jgi:flagellar biosynthesis protein FliQ
MMDFDFSIVNFGIRLVFASALPFLVAAMVAAVIVGILKTATQIDDRIFSFAGRLFGVMLVAYFFFNLGSAEIVEFARRVWGGTQFYY